MFVLGHVILGVSWDVINELTLHFYINLSKQVQQPRMTSNYIQLNFSQQRAENIVERAIVCCASLVENAIKY